MKKWILLFILLPSTLIAQNLRFDMGISKGMGFHHVGIDFHQKSTESFLDYDLQGERFNMGIELDAYNVKFNYRFDDGNYSGFMWDTDYYFGILTDRVETWTSSYSNSHILELGYVFRYKHVDVGLFLSQFWMKLEYVITGGTSYISSGWYVDKPIYGLNSLYTDKNSGYGLGVEINTWKFRTRFNYFHRVQNSGEGWWNLRNMTWTINDLLDYYKGDVKFIGAKNKFFDVYLGYSFDVFHSIGNAHNAGSNSTTILNGESFNWKNNFNTNTKFYHGVGLGIILKI